LSKIKLSVTIVLSFENSDMPYNNIYPTLLFC